MGFPAINPFYQFFDDSGDPLSSGLLFTYAPNTSTKKTTYTNADLNAQNTNPIELDDAGRCTIFLADGETYKFVLSPADDTDPPTNPIRTIDKVKSPISIGQFDTTAAETASGVTVVDDSYPVGNTPRYGIVANSAPAAAANTAILKLLLDPNTAGITGDVKFLNQSGSDIYYFNDIIPIRDGIHIDLCGSTLHFSKTAVSSDTGSGFLWGIRDVSIENGYMEVDYTMTGGVTSAGYAIKFGGRGDDNTTYWPGLWDSLLSAPMGNCHAKNIHITSNVAAASGGAIALSGGLKNVTLDVIIDGQGVLQQPVTYEFGWATSGTTNLRQTSHMSGFNFRLRVTDYDTTTGVAVTLGGAYDGEVYLEAIDGGAFLNATPGESMFYRPWSGVDDLAKNSPIKISGYGLNMMAGGMTLTGHYDASGGYLSAIIAGLSATDQAIAQRDLATYEVGDLTLYGNQVGYGIITSARYIKTGVVRLRRFARGMYLLDECTRFDLGGLTIQECTQTGLGLNGGSAMSSPIRQKVGTVSNAFIAGNSTSVAGSFPGVEVGNSASVKFIACRANYETAHDGADETTQGNAFQLASTASGCVFDSCYVGALVGGTYAYSNTSVTAANGNTIINPQGSATVNRAWLSDYEGVSPDQGDANKTLTVGSNHKTMLWATTLTANRTVTLSTTGAKQGDTFRIVRTGLGSFTLAVGALKTIPSATAAFVDVEYNGSAWILSGYSAL